MLPASQSRVCTVCRLPLPKPSPYHRNDQPRLYCGLRCKEKAKLNRRRGRGYCVDCSNPIDVGSRWRCGDCRGKQRLYAGERVQEWKRQGLCTRCGRKHHIGKPTCNGDDDRL